MKESTITINNIDELDLKQGTYDNYYVIVKDSKLVLKSDSSYYRKIWWAKVLERDESIRIQYEWNILNQDSGKIFNVQIIEK